VAQSSELAPFVSISEYVHGFDSCYRLMRKEVVNALLKVLGVLWVFWFPPTGKVDRTS
jgi:hypothetical protein